MAITNGSFSSLERLHAASSAEIASEFTQLSDYGKCTDSDLFKKARFFDNCGWNRYSNIRPFNGSIPRFTVKKIPVEAGFTTPQDVDYYNASKMLNDRAIASEGPMESILDLFYGMIDQTGVTTVVTLTNSEERGKAKCYDYWSNPSSASASSEDDSSEVLHENKTHRVVRRTLNFSSVSRPITHYHLENWTDCDVVDAHTLAELAKTVGKEVEGPLLVHCSAGIGRTGTFLAAYEAFLDENPDLTNIARALRSPRTGRPGMIQNAKQYQLVYDAARLLLPLPAAASADLA